MSTLPPALLNALSFFFSLARKTTHGLNTTTYPANLVGEMPIAILLGDCLRLPSVMAASLADHPSGNEGAKSADMYYGWQIYTFATDCIMLHANRRCRDPKLASLLSSIR